MLRMPTVKIGVISDTHVSRIAELPPELVAALKQMGMVVHLGDFTGLQLVEDLRRLGRFRGVRGNMDLPFLRLTLPEVDILEVGGKRIGLIHGWGAPTGLEERVRERFDKMDAILYGHSHIPKSEVKDGTLLFNPGSATGKYPAPYKSYGILTIDEDIRAEIIRLEQGG